MFRFLRNLFAGHRSASSGQGAPRRIEITQDDLRTVATLAPRVVEILQARPEVRSAVFDATTGMIRVTYRDDETQTMSLDNLLVALRQMQGEGLAGYLQNFLTRPDPAAGSDGYLLPVLKPVSYIAQTRQSFIDAGIDEAEIALPFHLEFAPGLLMIFVRDTPSRMHVLSERDVEDMGLDAGQLVERALAELAAFLEDRPLQTLELAGGRLLQFQIDDNYESSVAFLSDIWGGVSRHLGGLPGVAFVARNIVLAVNADDADSVRLLRGMLSPEAGDPPPYQIAPHDIYVPSSDGGWTIMAETEKAARVLH